MLDFDIEVVGGIVIASIIIILGFLGARYGNNKHYEAKLTFDQMKDYFLKKHDCKDCNTKLKRITKKEYLGEGWTRMMGNFSYSKKYRVTYYLKCPVCNRLYTSEDY
ncbi:hypothetical protein [Paenibacillus contaminans]|uniref:Uncharacterized protein n=1 Tax=Paenibacillus contaminans TaxID=450362 RepID=A0A329MXG7_9BACL|nr:hypothetical protein [Paenibacillus contaminans]RAV23406.1 hypothetical protein DQG23_04220 [Paenibacillus contaminans]